MARRTKTDGRRPIAPGGPSILAAAPPRAIAPPVHVYRWDLDKTYLKTEFDTLKQLLRSAFEGAEAKQAIPGASALLRELRARGGARICFISGSPRQMRRVLTKKLQLDGVEFDEFILKPNLRNMLTGRTCRSGKPQNHRIIDRLLMRVAQGDARCQARGGDFACKGGQQGSGLMP